MIATVQFLLCSFVFAGCWAQREWSNRFSDANRHCSGDVITTKIGQVGLAITSVGAMMGASNAVGWFDDKEAELVLEFLGFDGSGLTSTKAIILFLVAGTTAIQARVIYSSWLKARSRASGGQ